MSELQQRLEAAVADLREAVTWQDVAEILRAEGIKGRPGNCVRCPIAALVSKRLGGAAARVEFGAIAVATHTGEHAEVDQPEAVSEFISYFDGFDYFDRSLTPAELRDLVAQ